MNFKRGDILSDEAFVYPDGGEPCDKLLLVVNKIHIAPGDVVVVPAKTNIREYPYKPDCNPADKAFYFSEQIGFYRAKTVIQLQHLVVFSYADLMAMISSKRIDANTKSVTAQELGRIIKCLKEIQEDVPRYIQDLIL